MIGIVPGTILELANDRTIICKTLDEKNQVEFRGNKTSLSDAALQAVNSLGSRGGAISGPWAWTYQGKRLDDIRREIEERSD